MQPFFKGDNPKKAGKKFFPHFGICFSTQMSSCPDFPPQIGSHGYHKTAKPALEILAEWRFLDPTGSQKGGCRMIRLADFELNFEDETRKKPGGIHRA